MKNIIILLTLLLVPFTYAEETPSCSEASMQQITDLSAAINRMYDRDGKSPLIPSSRCFDPPQGYTDCMKDARDAYDDEISDIVDAALANMEAALLKATIQHAAGKAASDEDKGCKMMQDAGADASFAQWEAEEGYMKDSSAALQDYYAASDDCCHPPQTK